MTKLYLLSVAEREPIFDATAEEKGLPFEIVEKDYWVVWALETLFSLPDLKEYLTFKGGTSLSKVYNVIQRFSEDIDLSIEKEFFGFDKSNAPEQAVSKKKQRAALENLSALCSHYVKHVLVENLRFEISQRLGTSEGWCLKIDSEDPDGQTLQFEYPGITKKDRYIRPSVKIELGARSEHWPVSACKIQSYAKGAFKSLVTEPEIWIKVLDAKRTFWEKATILHQYAHLPQNKQLPPRISRHYYDFFCLLNSEIKKDALADQDLLDRVAMHKSIYFASAWANYGTAKKGSLKLLPPFGLLDELKKDFDLMQDMFFGEFFEWNTILKNIQQFEISFNESG